jgi:site-specific DNA recombinase
MPPKKKKVSDTGAVRRVVTYIRVSTNKQAEAGLSLEAQEAKIVAYAAAFGLEIIAAVKDTASASSLERPGLKEALDILENGNSRGIKADGILVVKLDRLTRSVRDLVFLIEEYFSEHALLSVSEQIDTGSAAGRMMLKMLTTIGEWEREAIGERTAAVMQHMKAEGLFTGGFPPFGWNVVDGRLEESWEEQQTVAIVKHKRERGQSIRMIAEGTINPRTGRAFHPTQIARML